jgi:hypothetical protein
MGVIILLVLIPTFSSLILCALVENAIPAIIVGGISFVLLILGFIAIARDDSDPGTAGGTLGVFVLVVIPSAVNALLLLGGSGIYYLSRALGS